MMGKPDPLSDELAALLRYEGDIEPTPAEVRRRVLARARLSQGLVVVPTRRAFNARYVAAGVFTLAFGAAAFTAIRSRSSEVQDIGATLDGAALNTPTVNTSKVPADLASNTDPDAVRHPAANSNAPTPSEADGNGRPKVRETNAKTSESANDPLARELVLLKRARSAVSAGNQAAALTAIGEHAQQFPSGRLREEREALRVTALWNMGRRAEAQRAAARFVQQFPRSVLAAQMAAKAEAQP